MRTQAFRRGYSLVELLVVLVIVGILVTVGVTMIADRKNGAVRSVLDEMEGVLLSAQHSCGATGRDVILATQGSWSSSTPFLLTYGSAATSSSTDPTTHVTTYALTITNPDGVASSAIPYDPTTDDLTALTQAKILTSGQTASASFRFLPRSVDHRYAGVVVAGTGWWSQAESGFSAGATGARIASCPPFNDASTAFSGIDPTSDTNNLTSSGLLVRASGYDQRFHTPAGNPFFLAVVSLRDGQPVPGGPMGLLVVLNGGGSVFKFYNPGVLSGDGKWRKL